MEPCSQYRNRIAGLALHALEPGETALLRDHLAECEACRRYSQDILYITQCLASAAPESDLVASDSFHRRVAQRIQRSPSSAVGDTLATRLRHLILDWRVALPACALILAAGIAALLTRQDTPPAPSPPVAVVPASASGTDPAPTIANYYLAASRSLEQLEDLLTRHGHKPLPPAPVFTASGRILETDSF